MSGKKKQALETGIGHRIPIRFGNVPGRLGDSVAGIIDEDIDAACFCFEKILQSLNFGYVSKIKNIYLRLAAKLFYNLLHFRQLFRPAAAKNEISPRFRQTDGNAAADALARAGYDGSLIGKIEFFVMVHLHLQTKYLSTALFAVLPEPAVRLPVQEVLACLPKPTGPYLSRRIEDRHVGFDVQKRRIVEHIHILDMQYPVLDPVQPNHRKADGVGTSGRPAGKDAARL